jgi:hypothetical protein
MESVLSTATSSYRATGGFQVNAETGVDASSLGMVSRSIRHGILNSSEIEEQ